jgi:hypothetical protein
MSTASVQVGKLEALLARVQHNRAQARGNGAAQDAFESMPSLVPAPDSHPPTPARAPAQMAAAAPPVPRPPARPTTEPVAQPSAATGSRPARTPLEIAVENKLERPSTHPHLQAVPSQPAQVPHPVSFANRPVGDEPSAVIDPTPPAASRSVGQVVSKQPLIAAQTFGDLLRRSLSLRPR